MIRSCGEKLEVCSVCGSWCSWWVLAPFELEYTGGTPYPYPAHQDRPGEHAKRGDKLPMGSVICSNHLIAAHDFRYRSLRRVRCQQDNLD